MARRKATLPKPIAEATRQAANAWKQAQLMDAATNPIVPVEKPQNATPDVPVTRLKALGLTQKPRESVQAFHLRVAVRREKIAARMRARRATDTLEVAILATEAIKTLGSKGNPVTWEHAVLSAIPTEKLSTETASEIAARLTTRFSKGFSRAQNKRSGYTMDDSRLARELRNLDYYRNMPPAKIANSTPLLTVGTLPQRVRHTPAVTPSNLEVFTQAERFSGHPLTESCFWTQGFTVPSIRQEFATGEWYLKYRANIPLSGFRRKNSLVPEPFLDTRTHPSKPVTLTAQYAYARDTFGGAIYAVWPRETSTR